MSDSYGIPLSMSEFPDSARDRNNFNEREQLLDAARQSIFAQWDRETASTHLRDYGCAFAPACSIIDATARIYGKPILRPAAVSEPLAILDRSIRNDRFSAFGAFGWLAVIGLFDFFLSLWVMTDHIDAYFRADPGLDKSWFMLGSQAFSDNLRLAIWWPQLLMVGSMFVFLAVFWSWRFFTQMKILHPNFVGNSDYHLVGKGH